MKPVRAAVIGAGYLGRFHAEKYAALPEVELVAVVDLDPARAAEIAARYGARACRDYREVFGAVDLVSVVVPSPGHYEIARACLEVGLHCLVEKPMTQTLAEADHLIALARHSGLVLQVGHLERFNPALLALRGVLGRPLFIESHRIARFQPRGSEVSVVMDLMIHDIDIILNMVQAEVTAIRPKGFAVLTEEVDIAHARLEFADGCVANVTASRVSRDPLRKIRVFQSDAYISIDYLASRLTIARRIADPQGRRQAFSITTEEREFERGDALLMEIRAFAQAVRNGTRPLVSGEDGRRALEIALAIGGAIDSGLHAMPQG